MINIIFSGLLVMNIIALCFGLPKNKTHAVVIAIIAVPQITAAIIAGVGIIGTVVPAVAYHVAEVM